MNKKILKICFVLFIFIVLEIIGTTNYTFAATKKITLAKPKVTKVCVDNNKAIIKWKKVKHATGYTVYMSNKKKGKYKSIKQIKNAKTLSYTKKDLNNKKEYFFKIKAYYKTKSKKIYSTYSNIRSGGGLLASKVLTATNSPEDRNINLMIASSKINGIILKPNGKFYWSKVVRNANRSTRI